MSVEIVTLPQAIMLGEKPSLPAPEKGWIAGGAIRRWFTGNEKLSDIDLFFQTEEAFNAYLLILINNGYVQSAEHKNAVTLTKDKVKVQCIRIKYYPNVDALLDSFDFTLCQFAWDGKNVFTTAQSMVSVLRNHLGVHNITKEYAVDSLRRAFKYAKKGFYPCNGSIMQIANSLRELTVEEIRNAIEISPGGGSRIIRID